MSDFSSPGGPDFNAPPPQYGAPPPPPPNMNPPPGYVPYGGQNYGAFNSFQQIGGIAKWLGGLVMVAIPLQVISLLLLLSVRSKAKDLLDEKISPDEYTSSAAPLGLVGLLSGLVVIAIVVLTMIWMNRMAKNQRDLGRIGTWTPGWAIAGWFCPPCVLYVIPYLMFRDLWKSSDPQSGTDWRQNPIGGIVHVWWVLYGLAPIAFIGVTFGNYKFGTSVRDAARNIDRSFALSALSNVVQIGAAIAFLLLVRQLTARHKHVTREA